MSKKAKFTVIVDGGIVQAVISDDTRLIGAEYDVIDYDCDECDPHDANGVSQIKQSDGSIATAYTGGGYVEKQEVQIL